MSKGQVMIVDCKYKTIDDYIDGIFDFLGLQVSGKSVLLKPNLLGISEPEQCMNTHPALVNSVIRCCIRRGASRVMVGDNMGQATYGKVRPAFLACGYGSPMEDYFVNLALYPTEKRHLDSLDTDVYVSRYLTEADVVISLPKMKTHRALGLTGAIKNQFGYLPGAQKPKMHVLSQTQERFSNMLIDVMNIRRPDAWIMDAITVLFGGKYPNKGIKYAGKLIASTDPVAVDAVMCDMFGVKREDYVPIVEAEKRGIGTSDYVSNVPAERLDNVDLPDSIKNGRPTNKTADPSLAAELDRKYPIVNAKKCIKCGLCAGQCPTGIIKMSSDGPAVTADDCERCALCFACMEVCPTRCLHMGGKDELQG